MRHSSFLHLTALFALGFAVASEAAGPDHTCAAGDPAGAGDPPKIGLVLGGGGARGAAHIGVLKELERLQVPVHAVAGTSIGAIVGGLYASGRTPAELEKIVTDMNWSDALSDRPNRSDLSFRRKQDDERYPINFTVGIKDGALRLPQGVIQGQTLDLILREQTLHVSHIDDFDDLPIPFRAIASDIGNGEIHVMHDGDLATAIRASMSVPAVFAPVERDDLLLVDGGLIGNLPVDVVRSMGADIVIAVDVEFPLYDTDALSSPFAITEQMLTILIRKETQRQIESMCDYDVLLRPELGMLGSAGFADILEAVEPGAEAARGQSARLGELGVDRSAWAEYLAARRIERQPSETLAFVRVEHDSRVSPALLERRMGLRAGDAIDTERLAYEANHLYGLQVFEKVGYRLVEENGATGVVFDARAKSWGNGFLRFGLEIEDDFEGSTAVNFNTQLWWPEINELGAEWRTNLSIGTDPLFVTEFYQPLRADSRLFVAPSAAIRQFNLNAFAADEAVARLRVSDATAGLDVGAELGTWGEVRAGLFRGRGNARVKVGDPQIPNFDFDAGGARLLLRSDTFDSARFPRKGTRGSAAWTLSREGLGADDSYDLLSLDLATAWSRGPNTLLLNLNYGTTFDSANAVQDFFNLGGFLRLSGLERNQIAAPHLALASLVYYRQLGGASETLVSAPVYLGASLERGNVWATRNEMSFESAVTHGSLFVGVDSIVGPIIVAAGFSEEGRSNFYLFIGNPFVGSPVAVGNRVR